MSGFQHPDERIAYIDAMSSPTGGQDCEPEFEPIGAGQIVRNIIRDIADYQPDA